MKGRGMVKGVYAVERYWSEEKYGYVGCGSLGSLGMELGVQG